MKRLTSSIIAILGIALIVLASCGKPEPTPTPTPVEPPVSKTENFNITTMGDTSFFRVKDVETWATSESKYLLAEINDDGSFLIFDATTKKWEVKKQTISWDQAWEILRAEPIHDGGTWYNPVIWIHENQLVWKAENRSEMSFLISMDGNTAITMIEEKSWRPEIEFSNNQNLRVTDEDLFENPINFSLGQNGIDAIAIDHIEEPIPTTVVMDGKTEMGLSYEVSYALSTAKGVETSHTENFVYASTLIVDGFKEFGKDQILDFNDRRVYFEPIEFDKNFMAYEKDPKGVINISYEFAPPRQQKIVSNGVAKELPYIEIVPRNITVASWNHIENLGIIQFSYDVVIEVNGKTSSLHGGTNHPLR